MNTVTTATLRKYKEERRKIVMVTAYDYPSAKLVSEAGVDLILVGDSLGMTVLGYDSTLPVTMEDMLHHTKAVVRGASGALVVADMPFLSYQVSVETALLNAGRLLQEAGAKAVKLEGGSEVLPAVRKIVAAGIPVIGHLGFTPQSVNRIGGAYFQGKTAAKARRLIEDAIRLEDAGISALVLELVPFEVADLITQKLRIPTIGIGSGSACDGQVLVFHDLLGFGGDVRFKHNKLYANVGEVIKNAVRDYAEEVRKEIFPTELHTIRLDPVEYEKLLANLNKLPFNR